MNPDGDWNPNVAMGLNVGRANRIESNATVAAMEVMGPNAQSPQNHVGRGRKTTEPTQPRVFSPE